MRRDVTFWPEVTLNAGQAENVAQGHELVSRKILGHRGGAKSGHADLQSECFVSTASGLAAEGDDPFVKVFAVRDGRRFKLSWWQDYDQTGRARARTSVVAPTLAENLEPTTQLQCSRKSSRIHWIIHEKSASYCMVPAK